MFRAGHSGVGNDDGVATQLRAMLLEKRRKAFATDFLLALDDERKVAGQGSAGLQIRLDSFEMGKMLAFVVRRAAGVERAPNNAWFERGGFPQLEGLGRLPIVRAIEEELGFRGRFRAGIFGDDNGVAFSRAKPRFKPYLTAMLHEPLCTGTQVLAMSQLRGD